jgi:hypothetical protein
MSKRKHHKAQETPRRPSAGRRGLLLLVGTLSLATVAVVTLVVLSSAGNEATARASIAPHVKGSPSAPVTVVEWGDFQ